MDRYTVKQLLHATDLIGQTVHISGWVRSRRDSKAGISFLAINDGSCFDSIQAVVPEAIENYQSEVLKLTKDCAVTVSGTLVESAGKGQSVEIQAETVTVVGWVESPDTYPVSPKRHTMEHLREYAHLRPRTNIIGAVTRVRHALSAAIHRFFDEQGFYWISTPIITSNDTEGAGELFRVSTLDLLNTPRRDDGTVNFAEDFFGQETFLTVSGQLNVESYCLAMSKVYTFGPTFRAENSNTSRHLAEFWMMEPEIAFASLQDDMDLAEAMLKFVVQAVFDRCEDDLAFFNKWVDKTCLDRLKSILDKPFERLSYREGIDILLAADRKFEYPVAFGCDLQSEHERYICETHVGGPTILYDYPKDIKAFYMRLNDDDQTVAAMDVLVPGVGELIGGSAREERLTVLDDRILEMGLDPATLGWYRDLRRYGTVPHAGFGLGFERLVSYVTGVANVRDVIPFPRVVGSAHF